MRAMSQKPARERRHACANYLTRQKLLGRRWIEEDVKFGDLAVPDDGEVGPGITGRLAGLTRGPACLPRSGLHLLRYADFEVSEGRVGVDVEDSLELAERTEV